MASTSDEAGVEPGIALCLSGGGYRAMLFHVGAIKRLNELGYLPKLDRVSSVSGGSITAAVLGRNWGQLRFDAAGVAGNLDQYLDEPLRHLAGMTVDKASVVHGLLRRGSIADKVAGAYREHLFGDATLQDLPDRPRFVINSTNVQTGSLWRFSKPYMADYQVGMIRSPRVLLATAVAASSAFPPFLSPLRLKVDPQDFDPAEAGKWHDPPFTTDVVLTDGGVYDNLGLQTAERYATVLVSDGGGHIEEEASPHHDWARHAMRINSVIDNQVRDLRKRHLVEGFLRGDRKGTYWGIRGHVADYGPPTGGLPCPEGPTGALARTKTRLKATEPLLQERLINWGYAICDVAMRRWVEPGAPAPGDFPFASGVG